MESSELCENYRVLSKSDVQYPESRAYVVWVASAQIEKLLKNIYHAELLLKLI